MEKWKAYSYRAYDVWGSKLQEKYNFWNSYDNPELRKSCQAIWATLSPEMQKKIYNMLVEILKKYGPEFAKKIVISLSEAFSKGAKK